MRRPYFVADSASVTVLHSVASSAFGKYSLTVPEGVDIEDVYTLSAPGNELGYVAQLSPSGRRVGGFARRFVRADVSVRSIGESNDDTWTAASDVDTTLKEAASRVQGDFFLESDISLAGLGPWVPFEHFDVGDIADVEIWGRVVPLPVTRIEPIVSDHSIVDWRIHVGGQLVSDDEARLAENDVVRRAVVDSRRDLAGVAEAASKAVETASSAVSKADAAQGTADSVRTDFDELAKRVERDARVVADSISRTVSQADFEAYDGKLQSRLWGAQGEFNQISAEFQSKQEQINAQRLKFEEQQRTINDQQRLLDDAQSKQLELTKALTAANARAINLMNMQNHGSLYMTDTFVIKSGEQCNFSWSGRRGDMVGCHTGSVSDGGTYIKFDSLGDWQIYARVHFPPGSTSGTATILRINFNDGHGNWSGATCTMYNKGWDQTHSCLMTVNVDNPNAYCYISGFASTTSGALGWKAPTGDQTTEFSVRQLSVKGLS